jgi:hypothetical protein
MVSIRWQKLTLTIVLKGRAFERRLGLHKVTWVQPQSWWFLKKAETEVETHTVASSVLSHDVSVSKKATIGCGHLSLHNCEQMNSFLHSYPASGIAFWGCKTD